MWLKKVTAFQIYQTHSLVTLSQFYFQKIVSNMQSFNRFLLLKELMVANLSEAHALTSRKNVAEGSMNI